MRAIDLDSNRWSPFPFTRFKPRRILGVGGFGVAFLCHDAHINDWVVIKTLHELKFTRKMEDVFFEAQALRRITHPAIIKLWDCSYSDITSKTRPYFVMEYFDGITLEERIATGGAITVHEFIPIATQIAEALLETHKLGLLHRDVKPSNILIQKQESGWRVKLIDFGLAIGMNTDSDGVSRTKRSKSVSLTGKSMIGTLEYASPEQLGKLPNVAIGPYSDIYGFGKTCYYALFGTPEPDDIELDALSDEWRQLFAMCASRKIKRRFKNFSQVLVAIASATRQCCGQRIGCGLVRSMSRFLMILFIGVIVFFLPPGCGIGAAPIVVIIVFPGGRPRAQVRTRFSITATNGFRKRLADQLAEVVAENLNNGGA